MTPDPAVAQSVLDLLEDCLSVIVKEAVRDATGGVPQRYFNVGQAAAYCGLSQKSIRRFLDTGKLTRFKPNGRDLIDRQELDALIRCSRTEH